LRCTIDGVTLVVFVNVSPSIYFHNYSGIRNSAECAIICVFVTRRLPLLYEKEVGLVLDFVTRRLPLLYEKEVGLVLDFVLFVLNVKNKKPVFRNRV